jgi:hypothetical protein
VRHVVNKDENEFTEIVREQLLQGAEQGQAEGREATYEDKDDDSSARRATASALPGAQVGTLPRGARLLSGQKSALQQGQRQHAIPLCCSRLS